MTNGGVTQLQAGVDDCGSGAFRGYACIIVSAPGAQAIERAGRALLAEAGLPRFHGREFNPGCTREVDAYSRFADAIRDALELNGEYAAFNLLHPAPFRMIFDSFARRVTDGALGNLMTRVPEFCLAKAGALFWLSRRLDRLAHMDEATTSIDLDQDQPTDAQEGERIVGLCGAGGALLVPAADALTRLANAYKRQQFPRGPSIGRVRVCRSHDSMLVQAADLLANFGLAHLKVMLRGQSTSSPRELARAQIFGRVMPDDHGQPSATLSLSATGDIQGSENDNVLIELEAFP